MDLNSKETLTFPFKHRLYMAAVLTLFMPIILPIVGVALLLAWVLLTLTFIVMMATIMLLPVLVLFMDEVELGDE
ncbi:MAG: hypothetical protein ACXABY_04575 [Candidatus Thorarchaeota archaeon]|jgi:hypothetical protein